MITSEIRKIYKKSKLNTGAAFYTVFYGDTADEKPDFAQTDDKFVEKNAETGQRKIYECTRTKGVSKWELIETIDGGGSDGGSDGGSASVEQFVITFTLTPDQESDGAYFAAADKTYAEVVEAYDAGNLLVAIVEMSGIEAGRVGLGGKYFIGTDNDEPTYNFVFDFDNGGIAATINLNADGASFELKEAAQPSGGGGAFVVNLTNDSGVITADKTLSEIGTAFAAGIIPNAVVDGAMVLPLQVYDSGVAMFGSPISLQGDLMYYSVVYTQAEITLVPTPIPTTQS